MSVTAKDMRELAGGLSEAVQSVNAASREMRGIRKAVDSICDSLRKLNERFDEERFRQAVYSTNPEVDQHGVLKPSIPIEDVV